MKKQFRITLNGKSYDVEAEILGEEAPAGPSSGGGSGRRPARSAGAAAPAPQPTKAPAPSGESGDVPSPLAGKVVSIEVSSGDTVEAGQTIIILEAMKMNTVVSAPVGGTVKKIHVQPGAGVEEGQALMTIQ